MKNLFTALFALLCTLTAQGQDERLYLSGKGLGDTQTWEFYCTAGRRSGAWQTIEVPSQWELEGFGEYCYGRWYKEGRKEPPREEGIYRRRFTVPKAWRGQQVRLIFEGVMTDAEVLINGQRAGAVHRGAFYEFAYDISRLVKYGAANRIEVRVKKESDDRTVNRAERKADWWLFGGIFRPVYLEVRPATHIADAALDPRADGSLGGTLYTSPLTEGYRLELLLDGERVLRYALNKGTEHPIEAAWIDIKPWSTESPNRYTLTMRLLDPRGRVVHTRDERIGFRTIELRPADGLYLNGTKLQLKGINRHSFHPDGGRTTNAAISRQDGELIKAMNMNAVRVHYAPDRHFLDVCDSLGIVVVDELCGWQNAYSTEAGRPLVEAFVRRDRNRPSVIIWSNGNEGGWNTALDPCFGELDPQHRPLIHPWADFGVIDTHHYPAYQTGIARFTNGQKLFMPTEFMHGMYDQGHGAGLEDFWTKYTASPLFVGGFMWDFSDNAVRRTDRNGALDSDASNGADGILGPYREKEASYFTVRDIWAPIQFEPLRLTPSFDGRILTRNDHLYTPLSACSARYRVMQIVGDTLRSIAEGAVVLPAVEPRCSGFARMAVPNRFWEGDILEITCYHPSGEEMVTRTYPIHRARHYLPEAEPAPRPATLTEEGDRLTLAANGVRITFDRTTGRMAKVANHRGDLSFGDGPILVGMNARLNRTEQRMEGDKAVFTAYYLGAVDSIRWELRADGTLSMAAVMLNRANGGKGFDDAVVERDIRNFGFSFRYPEEQVKGVEWFGRGPYRVWKNRIRGTQYGIWQKAWNDSSTGAAYDRLVYPEFRGYHAEMRWMTLRTREQDFTIRSASDGLFMRLYTPDEPADNKSGITAYPDFPEGDLSFLYEIPAMRCFKPLSDHGPSGQAGHIRIKKGDEGIRMELLFDFRATQSKHSSAQKKRHPEQSEGSVYQQLRRTDPSLRSG